MRLEEEALMPTHRNSSETFTDRKGRFFVVPSLIFSEFSISVTIGNFEKKPLSGCLDCLFSVHVSLRPIFILVKWINGDIVSISLFPSVCLSVCPSFFLLSGVERIIAVRFMMVLFLQRFISFCPSFCFLSIYRSV